MSYQGSNMTLKSSILLMLSSGLVGAGDGNHDIWEYTGPTIGIHSTIPG